MQQTVFIKGMVCNRCITFVTHELTELGIPPDEVSLGEVKFSVDSPLTGLEVLHNKLAPLGFSVIENKRAKLVRQVREIIADVYSGNFDFPYHFRLSDLLTKKLNQDYHLISQSFSAEVGTTIENYVIAYRTERVKEMITHSSISISDISFQLGFSSVAHLSRQFKQQTGLTLSQFRSGHMAIS